MKELVFMLPDDLVDKFELTVQLTNSDKNAMAEAFVRDYLGKALQSAANEFRGTNAGQRATVRTAPPRSDSASQQQARQSEPVRGVPNHQRPPRPGYWQEWGKAINRIPRWAQNPQQNNHKILRAFFELQQEMQRVTLDALRLRCSDPNGHPDTYVPHFDNNFAQMKFDNGHSHGKVFEERDGFINIWDHISDTLMKYRDYFL